MSVRTSRQCWVLAFVASHNPLLLRTVPPCTLAPGQTTPMCEASRKPEVQAAVSPFLPRMAGSQASCASRISR